MKLGCLPYLNVKPLVYPLEHGALADGWELIYAPPSQLAQMLVRGEVAAAPVSSFATFTYTDLSICPGICIAADGPVTSVLLLSKVPIEDIKRIALDTSSLSGANMLKILLSELYNMSPDFVSIAPNPVSEMLARADAAMVIGNAAMQYPKDGLHVFDLAEHWRNLTGLPAVFAVWAGKGITPELVEILQAAKKDGLTRLPEIAREESMKLGLSYEICYDYLSKIMVYDMCEREMTGLELFKEKCIEHRLVEGRR